MQHSSKQALSGKNRRCFSSYNSAEMFRRHFLFAAVPLGVLPALAKQGNGQGKGHGNGNGQGHGRQGETRFGRDEVPMIVDYYRSSGNLPPGLAKRGGNLPPGLQKQLRRNGTLPPGLQKRMYAFPPDLDRRLPPVCGGCRRAYLDGWALLINDATNVVLDIIDLRRR